MCENSNKTGAGNGVPQGISIRPEGEEQSEVALADKARRVENYVYSFEADGRKFYLDIGINRSKRRKRR